MIRALVCIKSIPNLEQVVSHDWKYGSNLLDPDVSYVSRVMNNYDENAIEILLRFRDICAHCREEIEIDVITIGDAKSVKILEDSYALGANSCILIESTGDFKDNSHAVADILCKYIVKGRYDIIMCGESAAPYDNGQTAFALSYMLKISCIADIQELRLDDGGIKAIYKKNGVYFQDILKKPFVGTVGNVRGLMLRLPTLKERLLSRKKNITKITINELGLSKETLSVNEKKKLVRIFADELKKECCYIDLHKFPEQMELLEKMLKDD